VEIKPQTILLKTKKKLASLLITCNLSHKVNFVIRIQNNSSTAIYNIFVDISIINLSSISPIINCLSDHDAQVLKTEEVYAKINKFPLEQNIRLINMEPTLTFQALLNKT